MSNLNEITLMELRKLGKEIGVKGTTNHPKSKLIELIEAKQRELTSTHFPKKRGRPPKVKAEPVLLSVEPEPIIVEPADEAEVVVETLKPKEPVEQIIETTQPTERHRFNKEPKDTNYLQTLDSGIERSGVLEINPEGFGFLRTQNYMPSPNDVYVSPAQIRRFNLKTGDMVKGNLRKPKENEKFKALLFLSEINGDKAEYRRRPNFEDLTPIYPDRRMTLESDPKDLATRLIDLVAPLGFGQRGIIVAPPKAGKTVLIKKIARAILNNHDDVHLIVLLIDERPEEVTDMVESIGGPRADVVSSTFDEQPEHHKRISEVVLERAKRMVEQGKNLVILLDSLTRMSRAYNLTMPVGGRILSGGLDSGALYMPKKFFGAARNIKNGGSLTILATALVDTGSRLDDLVYEEFKGTGNMELVLDRRLSEKRIFPAIDINKSGTRREENLLNAREYEALFALRRRMSHTSAQEFNEQVAEMLNKTQDNTQFIDFLLRMGK